MRPHLPDDPRVELAIHLAVVGADGLDAERAAVVAVGGEFDLDGSRGRQDRGSMGIRDAGDCINPLSDLVAVRSTTRLHSHPELASISRRTIDIEIGDSEASLSIFDTSSAVSFPDKAASLISSQA